jgi:hypothetical protein
MRDGTLTIWRLFLDGTDGCRGVRVSGGGLAERRSTVTMQTWLEYESAACAARSSTGTG